MGQECRFRIKIGHIGELTVQTGQEVELRVKKLSRS